MMVMRPSPTLLLPFQVITVPGPEFGPLKVLFVLGSILAHGDHASHLWKSFTFANTTSGGAAMRAARVYRKSDGRVATTTTNRTTMTESAIKIMFHIQYFSLLSFSFRVASLLRGTKGRAETTLFAKRLTG